MLKKLLLFSIAMFAMLGFAHGHAVNYALSGATNAEVFAYYARLGFHHIVPYGIDHVLFVVALCLGTHTAKNIITQVSAFTVAHTVTLILSMQNVLEVSSALVEPLIAFSIVCLAAENYWLPNAKNWRPALVFIFGLLHGMGFAGALSETGLPPDGFYTALFSFNIGVEAGQLAIILLLVLAFQLMHKNIKRAVNPIKLAGNIAIALVAMCWFFQRILFS
jgi:hypothetical protein